MSVIPSMTDAQRRPEAIPDLLPAESFIPTSRLIGYAPFTYAPLPRPVVYYIDTQGFNGSEGFGEYALEHPEKFFSTLEGRNIINAPELFISRQMMLGNTLKIARNVYFLSGILYGSQMGVMGNNWGMGTREGVLIHPSSIVCIALWNQYFQSVSVYSPIVYPSVSGSGAAVMMPATPEVFSFGVQASFVVGEFIIDLGTSVSPVPFRKRKHSELRYR